MRIAVVGAGFAGLSAAARLAKLGHDITLIEATDELGGRLRPWSAPDGSRWHLSEPSFTLPGAIRDLFRKSGRPLERYLDIEHVELRRHVFEDRSELDLAHTPRSAQHDSVVAAFGEDRWSEWVDAQAPAWDLLRQRMLDVAPPERPDRALRRALAGRGSLRKQARKGLKDRRLRSLLTDPILLDGEDPRWLPGSETLWPYVERTFGRFRPVGGFEALADALETRMQERGVTVLRGVRVTGLTRPGSEDPATGATESPVLELDHALDGPDALQADFVVWCAGQPPGHQGMGLLPRIPAARTLVRLDADPGVPRDLMTHGNPPMHVWSEDGLHWTIAHLLAEDPLRALVRVGIDWRDRVQDRHDLRPADLVRLGHWGWQWMGPSTRFVRPFRFGPRVYVAGAHAHPGTSIELIAAATAAISDEIGPAPRT